MRKRENVVCPMCHRAIKPKLKNLSRAKPRLSNIPSGVALDVADMPKLSERVMKRDGVSFALTEIDQWEWYRNGDFVGVVLHSSGRRTVYGGTKRKAIDRMDENVAIETAICRALDQWVDQWVDQDQSSIITLPNIQIKVVDSTLPAQ